MSATGDHGIVPARPAAAPARLNAAAIDRLAADLDSLALLLDKEVVAALAGDSQGLREIFARKVELVGGIEATDAALRAESELGLAPPGAAVMTSERRDALAGAHARLRDATQRNETGLRAASEAIRRILEGCARALAAEDIGYGRGRLDGEARLFHSHFV